MTTPPTSPTTLTENEDNTAYHAGDDDSVTYAAYISEKSPNLNCRSTSVSLQAVKSGCHGHNTCVVQADYSFMHEDPCPGVSKYLQIDYQCVVTLGQPVQMTTTRKQPVTTPNIPVTTATRATPPTTTAAPPQTRAATTQPNLPPGIIPINVGGGGGGNSAGFGVGNSVSKNQTGVTQCHEFLVSGPRGVPDGQLSSSSRLAIANNAHRGRLYTDVDVQRGLEGAWTADPADSNPWIQVKMNWLTIVHGVTTQGRHVNPSTGCCAEWTTGYKVLYSDDGHTWNTVKDANGQDQVFVGNTDTDTPITHIFPCPIVARYIRLQVVSHVGRPSLRLELIGCPTNSPDLGTCPPGWKERPGSATCYFISDQSDTKTWENAMINCRRQQGQMVKIDSAAEKQWLIGELAKLQTTQKLTNFWTGLNNRPRRDNNYYHWHDGTSLNANVVNWRSGEPNNGGGIEHCAEYLTTTDRLNDRDCDNGLPYICELSKYWLTPVSQAATPPTRAPGVTNPTTPTTTTVRQSTLAPTTIQHKLPIPIGGSLVNTGKNNFTRVGGNPGCLKTSDCQALPGITYGDYPSCTGCGFFMTCAPSGAYDRNCPLNLKYDANKDACSRTSSNCAGP
ncbi:uncharacterized protein LOC128234426 [Mya arenaria]|uniref:uncharacterized protein LOC128234426 n=1 Tax=Mya arenaria TaxID=6604 RepID=UPI0022E8EBFD|nr:uncharacterized protein LOC128234426 [Mya arenaria]